MEIDLALGGFILGAVGTVLSSFLAVSELVDRLRIKTEERASEVKAMLREVIGPVIMLDTGFTAEVATNFARNIREKHNRIFGLFAEVERVAPEISYDLGYLLGWIAGTETSPEIGAMLVRSEKMRPLIRRLSSNITKWLSDHA